MQDRQLGPSGVYYRELPLLYICGMCNTALPLGVEYAHDYSCRGSGSPS